TVVFGSGYWDTLATTGRDRPGRLRSLVEHEVAALAGANVVVVRIDDWSKLVDPRQAPVSDRLERLTAYNVAIDALVARRPGVGVLDVPGTPTWDDVRAVSLP